MNPTKKQKMMLDFIDGFIKGTGYSPTLREIMQALGYRSVSTVAKHVDNLIARGWLIKRDGEARSLEVVTGFLTGPKDMTSEAEDKHLVKLIDKRIKTKQLSDDDRDAVWKALKTIGLTKESHEVT